MAATIRWRSENDRENNSSERRTTRNCRCDACKFRLSGQDYLAGRYGCGGHLDASGHGKLSGQQPKVAFDQSDREAGTWRKLESSAGGAAWSGAHGRGAVPRCRSCNGHRRLEFAAANDIACPAGTSSLAWCRRINGAGCMCERREPGAHAKYWAGAGACGARGAGSEPGQIAAAKLRGECVAGVGRRNWRRDSRVLVRQADRSAWSAGRAALKRSPSGRRRARLRVWPFDVYHRAFRRDAGDTGLLDRSERITEGRIERDDQRERDAASWIVGDGRNGARGDTPGRRRTADQ